MNTVHDKWVNIFDITEISKHKKGFTIYKIISLLYPEESPDAVTKVTVWKRYNDFKILHREIKSYQQTLKITEKIPSLPAAHFFKRFNEDVIEERKKSMLLFLEYISKYPQLYTHHHIVKFFETSHTPYSQANSCINLIRAELNLPSEPEFLMINTPDSDDEQTISDSDSVSTRSSLSSSMLVPENADLLKKSTLLKKSSSDFILNSAQLKNADQTRNERKLFEIFQASVDLKLNYDPSDDNYGQYLVEANVYQQSAIEYESEMNFTQAFIEYKKAIFIIIKYVSDDIDLERKQFAFAKLKKYSINAKDIYLNYVCPATKNNNNKNTETVTDVSKLFSFVNGKHLEFEPEDLEIFSYNIEPYNEKNCACLDYVTLADKYFSVGREFEKIKRYKEAFFAYNEGISSLLDNVKAETEVDNKQLVKFKAEKYLLKAEKIHDLYLSKTSISVFNMNKSEINQEPLSDLNKYRVLKIKETGMLVLHADTQKLYYLKVLCKSEIFDIRNLKFPTVVPYMIELCHHYIGENALFLVMQFCSGKSLLDHLNENINSRKTISTPPESQNNISDNESEASFHEIVDEYISNKKKLEKLEKKKKRSENNTKIEPMENLDIEQILKKSQDLLSSVDRALSQKNAQIDIDTSLEDFEVIHVPKPRKISETSSEYDVDGCSVFSVECVVKWGAQLLLALEELHKQEVICCDIQLKHLLINEENDLLLTYKYKINEDGAIDFKNNTILAPEVYGFKEITTAVDWWAYGKILYEMLVGIPIRIMHPEGLLGFTMLRIPGFVSAEGRSLLKQLLVSDPSKRLGNGLNGTEEIKMHPFFSGINWNRLSC